MNTDPTRRMKTIPLIITLVAVVIAGILLIAVYQAPLGPTLGYPTFVGTATQTPISPATSNGTPALSGTNPASSRSNRQPLCGGPEVMTLLAIGSDARGDNYLYGLADAIRIVRIDFIRPRVTILELPRDLWVDIPDISDHYGITEGKLNQAYFYGNPGMGYYDGPGQGPGLLARTLDVNFGIRPDHYIAVNMRTFEDVVNALGGLDVYMPYPVDATSPDNPNGFFLGAGNRHLDGYNALELARVRPISIFNRAENQNIVLCALRKKLLSPRVMPALDDIIQTFVRHTQTDLSPQELAALTCLGTQMSGKDILFANIPMELFTQARKFDPQMDKEVYILEVDNAILREYIRRFNLGTFPDMEDYSAGTPSPTQPDSGFTCDD